MQNKLATIALGILLTTGSAWAQFEGVLEMKMTMSDPSGEGQGMGNSTMKFQIGKAGSRIEMNMKMRQMSMNMVMLQKADQPDITYRINDANKTYTEINHAKAATADQADKTKYTVEKLGNEKILGYDTVHVRVKQTEAGGDKTTMTSEMWLAKEFGDYARFSRLSPRAGARKAGEEGLLKALKDAGAEGMPLKSVINVGEGMTATMEVVKIEKQSLPASTFEIPAGYTKSAGGALDMGGMSGPGADEARQKMQDALKNMTPEQREMIEKMMKQRQGTR